MGFDLEEHKRQREHMRLDSGCKNTEWCGNAICRSVCSALIFHGPGHQSKSHCDISGPHILHHASGPHDEYQWYGENAFSGFFDESPE